ncbi:cysteine hydrolase [Bacillus sp. ISL-35]|uniref:cysteine hydrolase family protein n=1 Tax=Bacillus sp. ISL-35 TaxID=2819122 RepID=UPI001BEB48F8|nr:cysteine hydrolase family protein [Bacillus sp. ISL-35]MBT2681980.1 cysteine hydrolase [Bacillus sp. ISL-35]MBT2706136.1 cysteine hydrolase [Chryseobacterium sp. ISL-80]
MNKKALLVIDVQNEMFQEGNEVFNGEGLLKGMKKLLEQARVQRIPVFYIQHNDLSLKYGTHLWEVHSEIAPQKGDIRVQKNTPDSFFNTNLEQELKEKNIQHLVLAGIQTEICVDTTCRSAFSKGYKVTLVSDLHSTWPTTELSAQQIINHHNGVLRWFADVKNSDEIINIL